MLRTFRQLFYQLVYNMYIIFFFYGSSTAHHPGTKFSFKQVPWSIIENFLTQYTRFCYDMGRANIKQTFETHTGRPLLAPVKSESDREHVSDQGAQINGDQSCASNINKVFIRSLNNAWSMLYGRCTKNTEHIFSDSTIKRRRFFPSSLPHSTHLFTKTHSSETCAETNR